MSKVVDLVPLRALSGPEAPDPNLARFRIEVRIVFLHANCSELDTHTQTRFQNVIDNRSIDMCKRTEPIFQIRLQREFTEALFLQRGSHL